MSSLLSATGEVCRARLKSRLNFKLNFIRMGAKGFRNDGYERGRFPWESLPFIAKD
jgi:hypothetical protein